MSEADLYKYIFSLLCWVFIAYQVGSLRGYSKGVKDTKKIADESIEKIRKLNDDFMADIRRRYLR